MWAPRFEVQNCFSKCTLMQKYTGIDWLKVEQHTSELLRACEQREVITKTKPKCET